MVGKNFELFIVIFIFQQPLPLDYVCTHTGHDVGGGIGRRKPRIET